MKPITKSIGLAIAEPFLRVLPPAARRLLVDQPALKNLLLYGGRKGLLEQAATEGVRGRWVEDVEVAPTREDEIVDWIIESHRKMKAAQRTIAPAYRAGAEWQRLLDAGWEGHAKRFERKDRRAVASFLRNFFRNEGIAGIWGYDRVFEGFSKASGPNQLAGIELVLRQIRVWRGDWPDVPVGILDAPRIGNPFGYDIDGSLVVEPMAEYHTQAGLLSKLVAGACRPTILEIGGGFGGLAWQFLRANPTARYIGIDLPENATIQSYFLRCAFPSRKVLTFGALDRPTVDDTTLENYDIVILPNFCLSTVNAASLDAIINVRSLSEMPAETIREYLQQIDRMRARFFFHENLSLERRDGLHGIPSSRFPPLQNYRPLWSAPSRWPKYAQHEGYPCRENVLVSA